MNVDKPLEKEFLCRKCNRFLDAKELNEGKCPECDSDEAVYPNDLLEEE